MLLENCPNKWRLSTLHCICGYYPTENQLFFTKPIRIFTLIFNCTWQFFIFNYFDILLHCLFACFVSLAFAFAFIFWSSSRIISCWHQISYLSQVRIGTLPEMPAESCQEIKESEGEYAVDGMYWMHFFDIGKIVLAHCDMTTLGK